MSSRIADGARGDMRRMTSPKGICWMDALARGYYVRSFGRSAGGDEVFRHLVLARIIEPVSKRDVLPVLEEAGAAPA